MRCVQQEWVVLNFNKSVSKNTLLYFFYNELVKYMMGQGRTLCSNAALDWCQLELL